MSQNRLPPPGSEACLVRLRPSSQKGGTLIAEDVTDRATHDRRICNPDGYRPPFCPSCGEMRLHVHDYRERMLLAEPDTPVATIVRHECVACGPRRSARVTHSCSRKVTHIRNTIWARTRQRVLALSKRADGARQLVGGAKCEAFGAQRLLQLRQVARSRVTEGDEGSELALDGAAWRSYPWSTFREQTRVKSRER